MPLVVIKTDPRAREKPCIRCGYSLRKVTDSPHCPECGLSVWLSLNNNDALDASNPAWLRGMAVALCVIAASGLLAFAALLPATADAYRVMQYRQDRMRALRQAAKLSDDDPNKWTAIMAVRPPRPNYDLLRISEILGAAALGASLAGLFALTAREGRYPDDLVTYRVLGRLLCGMGGLALLLTILNISRREAPLTGFGQTLSRLTFLLAGTVTWAYLRQIARRAPHKTLARIAAWMTFVPLAGLFYGFIRNGDWLPDPITPLFAIASAPLAVWFALLLKREARLADKHWADETAPAARPSN